MNKTYIEEIEKLMEKATPGPYFVGPDHAEECGPHALSGLAMIDTGRVSDWPVLRLGEWPTTEYIAALLNAAPALLAAAKREARLDRALREIITGKIPEDYGKFDICCARLIGIAQRALKEPK